MNGNALKNILIKDLIELEGGYVNHPNDSGGATKYGITLNVARFYGFTGDIKDLSEETAFQIYNAKYWAPLRLDKVIEFSHLLAKELFDTAVNCGPGTSVLFLQRCLNAFNAQGILYPDSKLDGIMGEKTLANLKTFLYVRERWGGEKVLLKALNCLQGEKYIELAEKNKKNESFVFGWFDKRVEL